MLRLTTLAEVARRARVHKSTASRALNRPELVNQDVVERVRAVAEELAYRPNHFARSLRTRDSRTLGLIVPDNTKPFHAEMATTMEAACFDAGYTLVLCNTSRSPEREAAHARALRAKNVDGVLMFTASDRSAETIAWLGEQGMPVVLLERRSPGPPVDCVLSDNAGGVRAAMEHLAAIGHRRIGCLNGEPDVSHHAERRAAYSAAVAELGLEDDPALVRESLVGYAGGQLGAHSLFGMSSRPTAIFCVNDALAIGAIRAARLAALRVPEDLAIVGFGDVEIASYTCPALTTVRQNKVQVGALAVRQLLARIEKRPNGSNGRPRVQVVPTELVVRESSSRGP